MNLAIDIGNSKIKLATFSKQTLSNVFEAKSFEDALRIYKRVSPDRTIISLVGHASEEFMTQLKNPLILSSETKVPVKIAYQTPETLGMDRLAAVVGASVKFQGQAVLVIDAGTCITYDFLDNVGTYHGGAISPGINMKFESLHNYTFKLPLVQRDEAQLQLIGTSTKESIISGVINGTVAEIDGVIRSYQEKYSDLRIVICGGDAQFFESKIKARIFAEPNLVLVGLNRILNYNNGGIVA